MMASDTHRDSDVDGWPNPDGAELICPLDYGDGYFRDDELDARIRRRLRIRGIRPVLTWDGTWVWPVPEQDRADHHDAYD